MGSDIKEAIAKLLDEIVVHQGQRATGFVIGNTAQVFNDHDFYCTPLRETHELIYAGVIVKNVAMAKAAAALVSGAVDYVFVDAEKKIRKEYYEPDDVGNIERAVRETVTKSQILTYKGNDLAVEAVDLMLGQLVVNLGNMEVAIIGAGNLGAKIALKLVERGARVRLYRRNKEALERIVNGLNAVKPAQVISDIKATKSVEEVCRGADIIIACANEKGVVSAAMVGLMNHAGPRILIDVGKGCFSDEVACDSTLTVYRADISIVQPSHFEALVHTTKRFQKQLGRRIVGEGLVIVSPGLLARYGEILVDDIDHPTRILGVGNGRGAFLSSPHEFGDKVQALKAMLGV